MTATMDLEFPVLTPGTVDLLGRYFPEETADSLRVGFREFFADHVRPLFTRGTVFDVDLVAAVGRAAAPRTQLAVALHRAIRAAHADEFTRVAMEQVEVTLTREGATLREGLPHLTSAFRDLREIMQLASKVEGGPGPEHAEGLRSILLRSVELDLCVMGAVAYLQGDLPDAPHARVVRACRLAAVNAAMISARFFVLIAPLLASAERPAALAELAGSWPGLRRSGGGVARDVSRSPPRTMSFLLDTDTVSYFLRGRYGVPARVLAVPASELSVSRVTLAELWVQARRTEFGRINPDSLRRLEQMVRCLPVEESTWDLFAECRAAMIATGWDLGPTGNFDVLIACTAALNGAALVTDNERHFRAIRQVLGFELVNWADPGAAPL